MIDLEEDFGSIRVHCRFTEAHQLVRVLQTRLRHFIAYVEEKAVKSGKTVLWTDQPGGIVTKAKFTLDQTECERLGDQIEQNKEFVFLAWTPWSTKRDVSVVFARRQLYGDKTHINFSFPSYYLCHDDNIKEFIEFLLGIDENPKIGFAAEISLRTENPEHIAPYELFNLYHVNCDEFEIKTVGFNPNSDLPEGVYADPVALAEEWIPKYRKLS